MNIKREQCWKKQSLDCKFKGLNPNRTRITFATAKHPLRKPLLIPEVKHNTAKKYALLENDIASPLCAENIDAVNTLGIVISEIADTIKEANAK